MTMNDIKKNKTAMTPCYTAPELFNDKGIYSFKTDLWALGCIMYEMALGQVPFFDERVNKLIMKIINDEINFNKKQFNQYSMEFMDVLKKLLEKDPDKRPSWGEIENFPFWGLNENNNSLKNRNLSINKKYYSLANNENSNLENINDNISDNSVPSQQHKSFSSSILNYNTNSNTVNNNINNKKINQLEIKNEKEYVSNQENNSYNNSKFKKLENNKNTNNNNELSLSLLKINKKMINKKKEVLQMF